VLALDWQAGVCVEKVGGSRARGGCPRRCPRCLLQELESDTCIDECFGHYRTLLLYPALPTQFNKESPSARYQLSWFTSRSFYCGFCRKLGYERE
jgi:hypothetical protein